MIQLPCPDCDGVGELSYELPDRMETDEVDCPFCEGSGYLLAPPDFGEVVAAVAMFAFVFAGFALFAWWILR